MKRLLLFIILSGLLISFNRLFAQGKIIIAENSIYSNTDKTNENTVKEVNEKELVPNKDLGKFYTKGINYSLPKSGFVTFKIEDYYGNEVACLVNREQVAGKYFANFSTVNLSSGIYRYIIAVDKEIVTNRILFVN